MKNPVIRRTIIEARINDVLESKNSSGTIANIE
jgi:hypothetical protein